jgi:hypothetical protein
MQEPQMRTMKETPSGRTCRLAEALIMLFALLAECRDHVGLLAGGPLYHQPETPLEITG